MKQEYLGEAQELALWIKESKSGKEYLSGIVKINNEQFRVVAFRNEDKQANQPDFSFKKKINEPVEEPKQDNDDINVDDVPF